MLTAKELALVILNVVFMGTFLSIFFFTYAHKIEQQVFTNQMNYITNDLLSDVNTVIPQKTKPLIKSYLNTVQLPDYSQADMQVTASNNAIRTSVLKIVIPTVVVSLLLTVFMSYKYDFSYKEIVVQSLMTLGVVGTVEYVFLTYFGSNYYSADVNSVKKDIITSIQENT